MRKIIILILALTLLTGCTAKPDIIDTPQTTPTIPVDSPSVDTTEPATSLSMPMITVSVPIVTDEVRAVDDTVIFRSIRQNMQLVMQEQDVADMIILDFLSRVDQVASSSVDLSKEAESAFSGASTWTPYLCSITYAPMRIDQSVLSLYGNSLQYSGGAHAVYVSRAANYNTTTGEVLTLGSIVVNEASVDQLCSLVITQLEDVKEEKYLRADFADTVRQRFNTEASYDENWYFSNGGLCFYFDHYAIAPYSSGVITVEIPYSQLPGIIDDAFFPPELDTLSGNLIIVPAENTDITRFNRISELVLNVEAPMYLIYTEGSVQNLSITLSDAVLNNYYTVFAAQSLCEADAIVVQADVNLFRHLNISYESNGQLVTTPLLSD